MRTSVNLRFIDIPKLEEAIETFNVGISELINRCLRKFYAAHPDCLLLSRINRLVEYQPKGVGYQIVGIVFDRDVYNLGVSFRSFCRISVSKIVTMAMEDFLEEVLCEIEGGEKGVHNYVAYWHAMGHNENKNCPKWKITWEVEGSKQKNKKKRKE